MCLSATLQFLLDYRFLGARADAQTAAGACRRINGHYLLAHVKGGAASYPYAVLAVDAGAGIDVHLAVLLGLFGRIAGKMLHAGSGAEAARSSILRAPPLIGVKRTAD